MDRRDSSRGERGAAKRVPQEQPRIELRDGGVHILGTVVECDPRVGRELVFVSRADRLPRQGNPRTLLMTEQTARMVSSDARLRRYAPSAAMLAVPPRRRFDLGTLRLELFEAGHALGGAMLSVEETELGWRALYAGEVGAAVQDPGAAEGFGTGEDDDDRDTREEWLDALPHHVDLLVIRAERAAATIRPPRVEVERRLKGWLDEVLGGAASGGARAASSGGTGGAASWGSGAGRAGAAGLLCDPFGEAPAVLALLARLGRGEAVYGHPRVLTALESYRAAGRALPSVRPLRNVPPSGSILLWPLDVALPRTLRVGKLGDRTQDGAPSERAVESGRPTRDEVDPTNGGAARPRVRWAVASGLDDGESSALGLQPDAYFPLSERADLLGAVALATVVAPREVVVAGPYAGPVVDALLANGFAARSVAEPGQMELAIAAVEPEP